jgi:hypothetical protein
MVQLVVTLCSSGWVGRRVVDMKILNKLFKSKACHDDWGAGLEERVPGPVQLVVREIQDRHQYLQFIL